MELRQFAHLARCYGPDTGRWPSSLRAEAQSMLERNPEARMALHEAQSLNRRLGLLPAMEITPALQQRILAIPAVCATSFIWVLEPFRPLVTLAACILFGLLAGMADLPLDNANDAPWWMGQEGPEELI